ncbi:MAG: IS630 family transposase [Bacteroidetes bacterium]|nr:IS630 family transposase [Bacteroidota bacterium]MBU1681167.1 IS630 family transposase [Bacteroidota bacterium]
MKEGYDKHYLVVCVDEKSKQLIEDVRGIMPLKPGSATKYDYEYKRNGTRNIFVAVEPLAGKRKITVTVNRKKKDFAYFIKELVEQDYKEAKTIRLVLDNLNTHFVSSFYETFTKRESKKILSKIEFYYTPKHGSWLNMAEIEINIMGRECLARRIGQEDVLKSEINYWSQQRNKAKKKINWSFTRKDADKKLSKHYVASLYCCYTSLPFFSASQPFFPASISFFHASKQFCNGG